MSAKARRGPWSEYRPCSEYELDERAGRRCRAGTQRQRGGKIYIDREQDAALRGERGPAIEWAMGVLTRLGDHVGSARLISTRSVHIPDWCGSRSSEAWTWLESVSGSSSLHVTANPGDFDDPISLKHKMILEGVRSQKGYSFTCAPYLSGNHPPKNEVVAWGGRAAVAFANSILGARSEMESFESAAASAITGLTPERGLHLSEKRRPDLAIVLPESEVVDYAALGWMISNQVRGQTPLLCGASPTFDEAKRLALALNSRGTIPLFRMQRARTPPKGIDVIELGPVPAFERPPGQPDLVVLGCPHMSEQDINRWSKKLSGRMAGSAEAWFFTSRICRDKCPVFGAVLQARGKVYVDLCPLAMKKHLKGRIVACDSPSLVECLKSEKVAAFYAPDDELLSYMVRA